VRALLAVLALGAMLALASGPASAEPVQRLTVGAVQPGPGTYVVLYEDPQCATHELLWQGGWFTASDVAWWAHDEQARLPVLPSITSAGSLTNHPLIAGAGLAFHALDLGTQAATLAPEWAHGNASAQQWALGTLGDEDVCMLSFVDVHDGL